MSPLTQHVLEGKELPNTVVIYGKNSRTPVDLIPDLVLCGGGGASLLPPTQVGNVSIYRSICICLHGGGVLQQGPDCPAPPPPPQ